MAVKRCPVVWSDEGIRTKNDIFTYLKENWTPKEIHAFFTLLDEQVTFISMFPRMGKAFKKSQVTVKLF